MSKINGKKISKQNQLHDIVDWNIDNLIFADPEPGTVPESNPPISFVRVNLLTQNHNQNEVGVIETGTDGLPLNDDSIGDTTFLFDRAFSFGVSESVSQETGAVTGHSMSLALWNREGATEREIKLFVKLKLLFKKLKTIFFQLKRMD